MTRNIFKRSPHPEIGLANPVFWPIYSPTHKSTIETFFTSLALSSPAVTSVAHPPPRLKMVQDRGDELTCTPDFKISFNDSDDTTVNVKPAWVVIERSRKLETAKPRRTGRSHTGGRNK